MGVVIKVSSTRLIEQVSDPVDPRMRNLAAAYSFCLCFRLFQRVAFGAWGGKFLDADAGRFRILMFDIR